MLLILLSAKAISVKMCSNCFFQSFSRCLAQLCGPCMTMPMDMCGRVKEPEPHRLPNFFEKPGGPSWQLEWIDSFLTSWCQSTCRYNRSMFSDRIVPRPAWRIDGHAKLNRHASNISVEATGIASRARLNLRRFSYPSCTNSCPAAPWPLISFSWKLQINLLTCWWIHTSWRIYDHATRKL